jgi:hypothetical protein
MNGLNNAGIFPYSLNNLQVLSLPDGASLPVSCDVPLIRTLTSTNQEISLFESSLDLVDFDIYDKSLKVNTIFAGSGSFNNIYSTGANFLTLNATGINCNTLNATTSIFSNGSMNAPNANITCFGINAVGGLIQTTNGFTGPFITASSGTFQNVNTNTLTANTININTVNIPNLTFNIATGGFLSTTGTISSQQSLRTTNGINTFDFTDISSSGDLSIYNAGGAEQGISFRFDGTERLFLRQNGELMVSRINCSGSFTGSNITTTNLVVKDDTNLFNLTVNNAVNAPNANITSFALTASSFVNAPYFTGAKVDTNSLTFTRATGTSLASTNISFTSATGTSLASTNISFTTATGGTVRSNLVVRNPQTLQFNKNDDTQILRIEPAGVANVLSYYDASNVLQETYTTSSSGANIDFINQLGTRDITNLGRIFNGDGTEDLPSYSFGSDTNSGFRRVGNDNIGLSLGGTQKANFQTNLLTLGSSSANSVGQAINGDLQVGRTSFNNVALINLGFSGAVFGVNPGRQGFITVDGTNMTIANTQANTGSTSQGSIFITPASSSNTLIKRADGKLTNTSRITSDYGGEFVNNNTGGFGMISRTPNSDLYQFGTQTFGNNSGITLHGAVSNVMSNITVGRTNFPFSSEEALTARPFSNTGSRTIVAKIANTVDEAFGYTLFGMSPSGATSGGKSVSNFGFINNSSPIGGFYICTNTNTTVPNTYPRYFVDGSGFHEFSVKTSTGVFSINSVPFSVGIGESFSSTRGQGRFVPLSVASLSVVSYTGGSEHKMRGTSSSNNNQSAFTSNAFSADFKGVYDIRYNLNMNVATLDDTVFIRIKVANTTRQVSTHRIATVASNASNSLLFSCNTGDLIELFIQPDTRNISLNNDSTFTLSYVG